MRHVTKLLAVISTVLFGFLPVNGALAQQSQTDRDYVSRWLATMPEMRTAALERELLALRLATELSRSKLEIDTQFCRTDRDEAAQTRQALLQLNESHRRNPVAGYGAQARQLQRDNQAAIERYKLCFTEAIRARYFDLGQAGVLTYDDHRARFLALSDDRKAVHASSGWRTFQHMADKVQEEIDRRSGNWGVGAQITAFQGDFQIQDHPGARWRTAERGFKLRKGSRIRTGNNSRVRLQYLDREKQISSAVNLGANTEINIGDMRPENGQTADVSLIRGLIHIFKKATGENPRSVPGRPAADFIVRAAVTLCGIRGTELAIAHNEQTGRTNYILREGDAFVLSNGQEVPLQANSVLSVSPSGQLSAPAAITQAQWSEIIGATESASQPQRFAEPARTPSVDRAPTTASPPRAAPSGRGYIGAMIFTPDNPLIRSNEYPGLSAAVYDGRVIVSDILRGGPAERAGLRPGDEIMTINGTPVNLGSFPYAMSQNPPGSRMRIMYFKEGVNDPAAISVADLTLVEEPR